MGMLNFETEADGVGVSVAALRAVAPRGSTVATIATTTVRGVVLRGAVVAAAAGANPTKAEYDGLLTVLRNAGLIT